MKSLVKLTRHTPLFTNVKNPLVEISSTKMALKLPHVYPFFKDHNSEDDI